MSAYEDHGCRVYWGHCGCDLYRGHDGPHVGLHINGRNAGAHVVPHDYKWTFGDDATPDDDCDMFALFADVERSGQ